MWGAGWGYLGLSSLSAQLSASVVLLAKSRSCRDGFQEGPCWTWNHTQSGRWAQSTKLGATHHCFGSPRGDSHGDTADITNGHGHSHLMMSSSD